MYKSSNLHFQYKKFLTPPATFYKEVSLRTPGLNRQAYAIKKKNSPDVCCPRKPNTMVATTFKVIFNEPMVATASKSFLISPCTFYIYNYLQKKEHIVRKLWKAVLANECKTQECILIKCMAFVSSSHPLPSLWQWRKIRREARNPFPLHSKDEFLLYIIKKNKASFIDDHFWYVEN